MRMNLSLRLLLANKDKEIEELKTEIEELNESIIWWSNRFNALQRDNSTLMEEIEQLKKELTEEKNAYIKMYNMYVEKDNIINEIREYFEALEIFAPSRDIKYDILDIIEGSDKE